MGTLIMFSLELRKIAAAALAETQKQRDKARKKLEQAIKVCYISFLWKLNVSAQV